MKKASIVIISFWAVVFATSCLNDVQEAAKEKTIISEITTSSKSEETGTNRLENGKIEREDSERTVLNFKKYYRIKAGTQRINDAKANPVDERDNEISYHHLSYLKQQSAEIVTSSYNTADILSANQAIVRNPYFNSYISLTKILSIAVDNDLFNNTDRYYTNGIIIKYQSPSFAFWKINSILPVPEKNTIEYNSLELHHCMFTPFTTKSPPLLKDDRPYASSLLMRFMRMAENAEKGSIQKAYIDIGVIGQAALGSLMQKGVHASLPTNDAPLGWETQIANDLILNYNYEYIKKIFSIGHLHGYSCSSISAGTLVTDLSAGLGFKIGTNRYFVKPLPDNFNNYIAAQKKNWDITLHSNFYYTLVGYNATLNGGLLNKHNVYVLEPHQIKRLIFNAEAKILISYRTYGISLAQYFISNEFKEGKNHTWGQIGLNFEF